MLALNRIVLGKDIHHQILLGHAQQWWPCPGSYSSLHFIVHWPKRLKIGLKIFQMLYLNSIKKAT